MQNYTYTQMYRKKLQNVNSGNVYVMDTDFYSPHILVNFSNILQAPIRTTFTTTYMYYTYNHKVIILLYFLNAYEKTSSGSQRSLHTSWKTRQN